MACRRIQALAFSFRQYIRTCLPSQLTAFNDSQALQDAAEYWDKQLLLTDMNGDSEAEEWIMPGSEPSVPWTARNSSELNPLINKEIMWLLKIAEDRAKNATGIRLSLRTARNLAKYTSIGYCLHENIRAWNCTR